MRARDRSSLPLHVGDSGSKMAAADDYEFKTRKPFRRLTPRMYAAFVGVACVACVFLTVLYYRTYQWIADREHALGMTQYRSLEFSPPEGRPFLPILMPAYGRPQYFRRVLDALLQMEGVEETVLVISQDGDKQEITDMIKSIPSRIKVIHLRHTRPYFRIPSLIGGTDYTTAANVFFLLQFAYEHMKAEGAIMLESDLVPSVDMYRYFQWTYTKFLRSEKYRDVIFNVNGFTKTSVKGGSPFDLVPYQFTVWGWCSADWLWPMLRSGWTWYNNWDITVQERIRIPSGRVSVSPLVSRIRVIGAQGITFDRDESDPLLNVHLMPYVANYTNVEPNLIGWENRSEWMVPHSHSEHVEEET
eukprot:GILK01006922.1.p1 GENE.GILK01006922.1~~GILK01006922.1.p1  ORF type:complete len:359 (+),score=49.21 GILK01006922.1:52-1128(+)